MLVSPMYALAFVFLLTSSILFLLWHFRAKILARIMPQDGLDIEIGRDYSIHSDRAFGDSSSTAAAPAFIISRLPVFKYPHKLGSSSGSSHNDTASDQESSIGSGCKVTTPVGAASRHGHAGTQQLQLVQQTEQQHHQQQQQQQGGYGSWIMKLIAEQQQQPQELPADVLAPVRDQQQPGPSYSSATAAPAAAVASGSDCFIGSHKGNANQHHHHQQQQQQQHQEQPGTEHEQVASNASSVSEEESCIICFSEYVRGDLLKQLPCQHCYHAACIDKWLLRSGCCPLCKVTVWQPQQFMQRLDQLAQEATGTRFQQQQRQRRSSSGSFESAVSGAAVAAGGGVVAPTAVA